MTAKPTALGGPRPLMGGGALGVPLSAFQGSSYSYPAGSHTWTCPTSGLWRLVIWGAGGGANNGVVAGGSGALYIAERNIYQGQTVALVIGECSDVNQPGGGSTATLPGGEVLTAGGGTNAGVAGAVTANRNLDIVFAGSAAGVGGLGNNPGSAGAGSTPGAGAPGYGTHRGGDGRTSNVTAARSAQTPGGGGAQNAGSGTAGGDGMALIYRVG